VNACGIVKFVILFDDFAAVFHAVLLLISFI